MSSSQSSIESSIEGSRRCVKCHCGMAAALKQAWTEDNPGRRFFACSEYDHGTNMRGCNFFKWYDQGMNAWQKDVTNKLILDKRKLEISLRRSRVEVGRLESCVTTLKYEIGELKQRCNIFTNELLLLKKKNKRRSMKLSLVIVMMMVVVVAFVMMMVV